VAARGAGGSSSEASSSRGRRKSSSCRWFPTSLRSCWRGSWPRSRSSTSKPPPTTASRARPLSGGARRAPGATSSFGSQAAIRRRWRCNACRDGAPQPRWLATSVVARGAGRRGTEEQRGTVMSTGSGMTASLFPRHSGAFVGRAPDTRTRVPKRSWPGDQGAASPRRPSLALGVGASWPSTGVLWPNGGRSA